MISRCAFAGLIVSWRYPHTSCGLSLFIALLKAEEHTFLQPKCEQSGVK